MPPGFPAGEYDKVRLCLAKYKDTHPAQWGAFSLGWNGLAYWYRAMAEYDEEFTISIKDSGNSPPSEERYKQGKALFGFFVNAVSIIECFFYSTYCMASILKPCEFPAQSSTRRFYAGDVAEKFKTNFSGDALTKHMTQCANEHTYTEMRDIRDVLSHRGMLPRSFYAGGERDGMATIPTNPKDPSDQWQYNLSIDAKTTASRRQWLCDTLKGLVAAVDDFCNRRL